MVGLGCVSRICYVGIFTEVGPIIISRSVGVAMNGLVVDRKV